MAGCDRLWPQAESTDDQSYSIQSKEDVKAEFELVKVLLNIDKIIIIGNNGNGCRLLAKVKPKYTPGPQSPILQWRVPLCPPPHAYPPLYHNALGGRELMTQQCKFHHL